MSKEKVTVNVLAMLEYANKALARTDELATKDYKSGICSMIEHILMRANRYKGYNYLYWNAKGYKEWHDAGEPDFPEKQKYIVGKGHEYDRVYY